MNGIEALREQFHSANATLEGTMQDVTPEQAHWAPPGNALPLGASYFHTVMSEDYMINSFVKGGPPWMATTWAGKAGVSEPYPPPSEGPWEPWAKSVRVDLDALRTYAKAIYANTDQFLASIDSAEADRELDLSGFGLGNRSVEWFLGNILLQHVCHHTGEISCLKGLQGAKGYPF
jgi:DinB superfamily